MNDLVTWIHSCASIPCTSRVAEVWFWILVWTWIFKNWTEVQFTVREKVWTELLLRFGRAKLPEPFKLSYIVISSVQNQEPILNPGSDLEFYLNRTKSLVLSSEKSLLNQTSAALCTSHCTISIDSSSLKDFGGMWWFFFILNVVLKNPSTQTVPWVHKKFQKNFLVSNWVCPMLSYPQTNQNSTTVFPYSELFGIIICIPLLIFSIIWSHLHMFLFPFSVTLFSTDSFKFQ